MYLKSFLLSILICCDGKHYTQAQTTTYTMIYCAFARWYVLHMVTIHHLWCFVSRSIWSHLADGSNCPGSYWVVTESNLTAGSLMMMSSVPLHWDPVQFQKQIQPFIFQIIVALYQLLPVFYLSLRLMWSFSQTAFCANGVLEHTWRAVCLCVC